MRLVDLLPRWIHPNVFTFLCPHCQEVFLTCKNVAMGGREQCAITEADAIGEQGVSVVLCKPSCAWNFENAHNFDQISITPSLDASAAGHWHGFITNGEIVGGIA
jgi:Family of unknown function (DUF6527)